MEPNLFRYILRHSWRDQARVLAIVLLSMVFYYLSLNLPKTIVNEAIQGQSFPTPEATVTILELGVSLPGVPGDPFQLFEGLELERVPYLFALSLAFLALVVVNNGFKYHINTTKGRLGERMLRRLRYELFDRILRFPLPHFRRVKSAEMATMIKDEVEPLGGFIGDAFVTPALLGGQAITAMIFIMAQSVTLGSVALVVVLFQAYLVPKLRRPVLRLGRQRQLTARELAGRIAETVHGIREIRVNDTGDYERASIADRLGRIFDIRFELYQKKFAAKLINNFLSQLTPFFFYAVGGYFAIQGRIDIGTLIAVIAAYRDLPTPLKELIDWDQQRQDVQIKYEQVIDQFQAAETVAPPSETLPQDRRITDGELVARNLGYADENEVKLLDGIAFSIPVGQRTAIVGPVSGGRHELALVLAGLLKPTAGALTIAGIDLLKPPAGLIGRRLAYAGTDAYLFPLSIYEHLVYGLWHVTTRTADRPDETPDQRQRRLHEAQRTGNNTYDSRADWVDYEAAGAAGPAELEERLLEILRTVELEEDVYAMGLRETIDPERYPALAAGILEARTVVGERLRGAGSEALVEQFDVNTYNLNATVAENLIFGVPVGKVFNLESLAENVYMRAVLERVGLSGELVEIGLQTSATMIELFADLPPDHEFFERYSFIRHEDLPLYKATLARATGGGIAELTDAERSRLTSLAFKLLPSHRLADLDAAFQTKVLDARHVFHRELPTAMRDGIDFFEAGRYTPAASVLDNILFGRIDQSRAEAASQVFALVGELATAFGLRPAIVRAGLDYHVGVGGSRLSTAQRQKVTLARALLKRPDLLVLDDVTGAFDRAGERRIMDKILHRPDAAGVVWVLQRATAALAFDHVLVVDRGRIVEQGCVEELAREGTAFHALLKSD